MTDDKINLNLNDSLNNNNNGDEILYYVLILSKHFENEFKYKEEKIFKCKQTIMSEIKKYKESRFKVFKDYVDAVNFLNLENKCDFDENLNKSISNEPSSPFRGPIAQDLTKFRRHIESGRLENVKELVLNNPRYLISSGDTPVILMEGPRYNAFHSAAKCNKVDVLKFIYDTLNDVEFMCKLYTNDDITTTYDRINRITDLYLNTPDKAAGDTPLHFACKFGAKECVELLLSYNCDVNRVNEQNLLAEDIICDRKGDEFVKKCIKNLFKLRYYVPVYRNELQVMIGQPCMQISENDTNIKAIAGPMTPEKAMDLFHSLKSPVARRNTEFLNIRLSDHTKGVERIGRILCKEVNVNWVEYWPFLNEKIDLASPEGLEKLEMHLKESRNKILQSLESPPLITQKGDISLLCDQLNDLFINSSKSFVDNGSESDCESDYFTPPTSPYLSLSPSNNLKEKTDFYIEGSRLTKFDIDAALALSDVKIDEKYQHINDWLKRVPLSSKEINCSTPVSKSPLSRIRLKDLKSPIRKILFDQDN